LQASFEMNMPRTDNISPVTVREFGELHKSIGVKTISKIDSIRTMTASGFGELDILSESVKIVKNDLLGTLQPSKPVDVGKSSRPEESAKSCSLDTPLILAEECCIAGQKDIPGDDTERANKVVQGEHTAQEIPREFTEECYIVKGDHTLNNDTERLINVVQGEHTAQKMPREFPEECHIVEEDYKLNDVTERVSNVVQGERKARETLHTFTKRKVHGSALQDQSLIELSVVDFQVSVDQVCSALSEYVEKNVCDCRVEPIARKPLSFHSNTQMQRRKMQVEPEPQEDSSAEEDSTVEEDLTVEEDSTVEEESFMESVDKECDEVAQEIQQLLDTIENSSPIPKTRALQKLHAMTVREDDVNRIPTVCTTQWHVIHVLATCLAADNIHLNFRRQICLSLINLSVPVENKANMTLGLDRDLLLDNLWQVIHDRKPESYLCCVCLMNLSYFDDAKDTILHYIPTFARSDYERTEFLLTATKVHVEDEVCIEIEQESACLEQPCLEQPSSLLRMLERMMEINKAYAKVKEINVETESFRWAVGLLLNMSVCPERCAIIGETKIPQHVLESLRDTQNPIEAWKEQSLEEMSLLLILNLAKHPESAPNLWKEFDGRECLDHIIGTGGIHDVRASAIASRFVIGTFG